MPRRHDHRARGVPRHDGAVMPMPNYRYRAHQQHGEIVTGAIAAPRRGESRAASSISASCWSTPSPGGGRRRRAAPSASFNKPKAEDVTVFTLDLALLLRAGARINDGLELLAADPDVGRLRPVVAKIRSRVVAGESFAEALARHEGLFPPMYVALVRVGEASGSLDQVLEVLAAERDPRRGASAGSAMRMRYPLFVLVAAAACCCSSCTFVLPQFASVLQDFSAKLDPIILGFLEFLDVPARQFRRGAGDRWQR